MADAPGSISLVARGGRGLAALAFDGERRLYVVASGGAQHIPRERAFAFGCPAGLAAARRAGCAFAGAARRSCTRVR